ncbi:MAG: nucleoside 2-deoxyribosyltransferase [Proteobacteria bacterium]|nr:nucleoside 2-deoxyribosyltransferase [Pseudomonadota bacterium]
MKQIYLAGPDVFLADAAAHFNRLCARCAEFGLRGVQPSDGGIGSGAHDAALARRILDANLALIAACDGLLANLQPFRNPLEPDSGTVFELGYAVALGKPVAGWLPAPHRAYEARVAEHCGCMLDAAGRTLDAAHGYLVESFGQPLNLMLACSTPLHPSVDAALADLAGRLAVR